MDYKLTNCRTTGTAEHLGCLAKIISQEILFTEILSHTQQFIAPVSNFRTVQARYPASYRISLFVSVQRQPKYSRTASSA